MATTLDEDAQALPDNSAAAIDMDPRRLGIQIEAKLLDWKLPFEYVEAFPIADIRVAEWAQVRGAANVAIRERVEEFKTHMAQGVTFPPIVIMGPNVMTDGNTRLAAARALRRKTIPAFVAVFNSVELAKTFSAAVNMQSGYRLTPSEAYQSAADMMNLGVADEAIARELGRSPESVRQWRRKKEYAERSAQLATIARVASSVPERTQIKLAQIRHDPVFVEAVKVAVDCRPDAKVISEMVRAATTARSDIDAIEAVRAIRAELAPAGPPPQRVTIPNELKQARAHLGGLLKLTAEPLKLLDQTSPEKRAESISQWTKMRELAAQVLHLYGSA